MSGRDAPSRLRRLLVMLPWLMERGEVPLAEVAVRFDSTETEISRDLELVALCGLPPYVDEMIDVFVDDGIVYVGVPRLFTRSLRLTAPEAFALLASARAAMELPGADPEGSLGRGLDKLSRAVSDVGLGDSSASADRPVDSVADPKRGGQGDDTAGVAFDLARPAIADPLLDAVADAAELEITYYSPARDTTSVRRIVARHVFVDGANWYVIADDGLSGERRTFRLDRIEGFERTGRTEPTDEEVAAPSSFFADADVPRARLRLAPKAAWVVDQYPTDSVTELTRPAGWVEVELPVASQRWLHRLLVRLGPDARLVRPKTSADGARELALAMLERYRSAQARS